MAGHVEDRWHKNEKQPDGTIKRVRTDRHGTGMRYRARYVGPDGAEKSKSFPDRQKRRAEDWLTNIEADMSRGDYIAPDAGRVTFEQYANEWMATQLTDPATRQTVEMRLRLHAIPRIGGRPMNSFTPGHLRLWLADLEKAKLGAAYRRGIFAHVATVFTAAVEDRVIRVNPCRARSVKPPRLTPTQVKPWTAEQVRAVRAALPHRYRALVDVAAGCGLRQGEVFGLAIEDLDLDRGMVHVTRQVKLLRNRPVFAPPKGGKERKVPLPDLISRALVEHLAHFPAGEVSLPWAALDGPPVAAGLVFRSPEGLSLNRNRFNDRQWRPALRAAGVQPGRGNGMHALRHFYASVLLDAGESIKALSEYLGHHDPGFTLRTYTHLMPTSETRTRTAVDTVWVATMTADGPETAPEL